MKQSVRNASASVTATSSEISPAAYGALRRKEIVIANLSAVNNVTIAKGETAAVAGKGIVLSPGSVYSDSDSPFSLCFNGAIQAVGDGNATIAIAETFVEGGP